MNKFEELYPQLVSKAHRYSIRLQLVYLVRTSSLNTVELYKKATLKQKRSVLKNLKKLL
jgi:hypothetical protein